MRCTEDALWRALCAFRQRAPPQELLAALRALEGGGLGPAGQAALLHTCLGSAAAAALPHDAEYVRRVLRAAVLAAEQDGQEVCDELAERLAASLLAGSTAAGCCDGEHAPTAGSLAAPHPAPGWAYKLYSYAPAAEAPAAVMRRLQELQQQAAERWRRRQHEQHPGQPPPPAGGLPPEVATAGDAKHGLLALHLSLNLLEGGTGCREWEAGFYLAEWVLSHQQLVTGRCCLELGCGSGMVGVALHRCGAARVILTDGNLETVANCRRNLALNGLPVQQGYAGGGGGDGGGGYSAGSGCSKQQPQQASLECRLLAWEDSWPARGQEQHLQQQQQPTVVLGADLLYDPVVIPVLLPLLKQVLAAAATQQPPQQGQAVGSSQQEQAAGSMERLLAEEPAVYLATHVRNEATQQQFLSAVQADPALCIQQLAPEPRSAGSSGGAEEGCSADDSGGGGNGGAGSGWVVRFQHLPQLEDARSRIILHRLSLAPPAAPNV